MSDDSQKIWIASDHGGVELKRQLIEALKGDWTFEDLGCHDRQSTDYPDYAAEVAKKVATGAGRGMLICGSGIGMAIAANKVAGVRATVAWDETSARLARQHNNTNILCLGERLIGPLAAEQIARVWLATPFEGDRHQRRLDKITQLEGQA